MNTSIKTLEIISEHLNTHISFYKYNSKIDLSEKYKKGRIDASLWLNDLIWFFLKKEKNFLKDFENEISLQKNKLNDIKSLEYKKGLIDELNTIKDFINDRNNNCK